jgi:hypothetical protein
MATELRVEGFNPYARKTPASTPNALTPATQLTLSMVDFALDSPAMHTRNAQNRLASRGFAFPSPKVSGAVAGSAVGPVGWGTGEERSGQGSSVAGGGAGGGGSRAGKQQGHDVSTEVKVATDWWVKFLCRWVLHTRGDPCGMHPPRARARTCSLASR